MGIDNDLWDLTDRPRVVTQSGDKYRHRAAGDLGFAKVLTPAELSRHRAGNDLYVEDRIRGDAAGVSTMALATKDLVTKTVEGLEKATHVVLVGEFKGERVEFFQALPRGLVQVKLLVAGRLNGRVMPIRFIDLKEI